jgi:hypothetical protein
MGLVYGNPVYKNKHDHAVARGKPPVHTRFKKSQSGNPRGRPRGAKNFSSVLNDALDQPVVVTENGRRRKISKRDLGIRQLVDKFAMAEMQATKMLLGLMLDELPPHPPSAWRLVPPLPHCGRGCPAQRGG